MESRSAIWGALWFLLVACCALTVLALAGVKVHSRSQPPSMATLDKLVASLRPVNAPTLQLNPVPDHEPWPQQEPEIQDYHAEAGDLCRPPASLRQLRRELRRLDLFPAGEGVLHTPQGKYTVVATAPVLLRADLIPDSKGRASTDDCFWDVSYGTYVQVFNGEGQETVCLGPFDRAALVAVAVPDKQEQVFVTKMLGGGYQLTLDPAGEAGLQLCGQADLPAAVKHPVRSPELVKRLQRKPVTKADKFAAFD